jgi:DNA-binding NarL/FixJ family response regulator
MSSSPPSASKRKTIRLALTDDHPIVLEGVSRALAKLEDFDLVGQASTADTTRSLVESANPDVLILDLRVPGGGTMELIADLAARKPPVVVLVFSALYDPGTVRRATEHGARGFLWKGAPLEMLVEGVRTVFSGEPYFPSPEEGAWSNEVVTHPDSANLSQREVMVLRGIARGYTNKQIALQLGISVKSVETYRSRLCVKLQAIDRADLVQRAYEIGVIDAPV